MCDTLTSLSCAEQKLAAIWGVNTAFVPELGSCGESGGADQSHVTLGDELAAECLGNAVWLAICA